MWAPAVLLFIILLLSACSPPPQAHAAEVVDLPAVTAARVMPSATATAEAAEAAAAVAAVEFAAALPSATALPPAAPSPPASAVPSATRTATSLPSPLPSPTPGEKSILVRLSEQRVYAYEGQRLVFTFPVSTGRNQNTAVGRFKVLDKRLNPVNARWGYRMPHWMGIYWVGKDLQNGFHALPLLADGARLWEDQIGTPASDGCVVLLPEDMERLYDWAEVGIPVVIEE